VLDPQVLARLRTLPEVGAVSTYRRITVAMREGELELAAVDPAPQTASTLTLVTGTEAALASALATGTSLLISEPLAYRLGLGPGDALELRTDRGWRSIPIAAVFRDYASERGYALVARVGYDTLFDDRAVASVALWAAPGTEPPALLAAAEKAVAGVDQEISVRSDSALREGSLEVFDRTFAVTAVLRFLCVVVAFLGVSGALTALQLERGRETGVLRTIGATPRQITALLTLQNALLGLCAGLLAMPMGLALAWLLIDVVNRRSFGWTLLALELTPATIAQAIGVALSAAVLAGLLPSVRLARIAPAEVLRSE
jgi:putative ABC transport system permease protein